MSASQEKKARAVLRSEGNDKKANAAAEKVKKDKAFRVKAIIAAVLVVLVIAGAFVINSNLFYTGTAALKVGDTTYTTAQVNCFYQMAFNNVYNEYYNVYGDYTSYFLDPSQPLEQQPYDENTPWADRISEVTLENIKQVTALYDEAMKNGYTLTEEDKSSVDSTISSLGTFVLNNGYKDVEAFLVSNYGGKGMTLELYRDLLTKNTIATSYGTMLQNSFSYSDEQLQSYYAAHADEYDYYSYDSYLVTSANAAL
jgi:Icc-related predicted phosphoesterase